MWTVVSSSFDSCKEVDVMADFTNDLADVLSTVADKVKEYGGYAKLQALIKAEEAKKQEMYYRLGKKYYELYKDVPDSELADIVDKLILADEKIAAYKEDLKSAQEASYTDVSSDATEAEADAADEEDVLTKADENQDYLVDDDLL